MVELIILLFIVVLCLFYLSAGSYVSIVLLGFVILLLTTKVSFTVEGLKDKSKSKRKIDRRVRPQLNIVGGDQPEKIETKTEPNVVVIPPLSQTAMDYYHGNYSTGELIDDKITRISRERSDNIHENLLRSIRTTKNTFLPYIADELNEHENSVWWENNNELEHKM